MGTCEYGAGAFEHTEGGANERGFMFVEPIGYEVAPSSQVEFDAGELFIGNASHALVLFE